MVNAEPIPSISVVIFTVHGTLKYPQSNSSAITSIAYCFGKRSNMLMIVLLRAAIKLYVHP